MSEQQVQVGQKAVGITFNPGGNEDVNQAKSHVAQYIDMLSVAITEAQTSQMWAVKAITWQY